MLTYDAETTLVLLHDASNALLVDVSLCIGADALMAAPSTKERKDPNIDHRWALERKSHVWVVGYLERVDVSDARSRYAQSISFMGHASACSRQAVKIAHTYASSLPTTTRYRSFTRGTRRNCRTSHKRFHYWTSARYARWDGGGASRGVPGVRRGGSDSWPIMTELHARPSHWRGGKTKAWPSVIK